MRYQQEDCVSMLNTYAQGGVGLGLCFTSLLDKGPEYGVVHVINMCCAAARTISNDDRS